MDALEAIVSGAPAFAVVSPLRQEEEEWFDSNNFEVGDPSSLGPGHHAAAGARDRPALGAANQSAPPAGAAAAQAQAAVGGSSVPSKRRRIVAVDDGGKSIANGDGLFSERRNKVGQRAAASGNLLGVQRQNMYQVPGTKWIRLDLCFLLQHPIYPML